jgi:hypothetical protein
MSISKSSIVCSVRPQVGINGYDSLQIIIDHHRSIWLLLYPILFPHGTSGWHDGLYSNNPSHGRKVTLSEFCRWYMMIDSHLHQGRKLYQQFIVDNYTRIEANNLNWIRMNQKTLRAELYNNLQVCKMLKAKTVMIELVELTYFLQVILDLINGIINGTRMQ